MATAHAPYEDRSGSSTGSSTLARRVRLTLALILALTAGLAAGGLFTHALAGLFSNTTVSRRTSSVRGRTADVSKPSFEARTLVVASAGISTSALLRELRARTQLDITVANQTSDTPHEHVLRLPPGASVAATAKLVSTLAHVRYAVPDYIAHVAGDWYPDDPGRSKKARGWEKLQWNFLTASGVNAPEAWANLRADRRAGARGVVIAVIDTGVAYRNWKTFKRSPDFAGTKFIDPCDLVLGRLRANKCTDPYALDRESHGTFVAGTIAEATNNRYGLTGLAYNATIMPVRVLDADGNGSASTIAAGIRYAVAHGAKVINLSIEFSPGTTKAEIPDIVSAVTYAHNHHVVVVGAAGNDEDTSLDYPAALPDVISVGATTRDRCLAAYSDIGKGLDIVAPGGGDDATSVPGSVCRPKRNLPDIYQMTFANPAKPWVFSMPGGWFGTSMAAPAVSAAAAMVIASGVIGKHPTPNAILARLEATARPLGKGHPNSDYGYGLLDIGAATAKGGPTTPTQTITTTTSTTTTGTVTATTPTTTTATTPTTTTQTTTTTDGTTTTETTGT